MKNKREKTPNTFGIIDFEYINRMKNWVNWEYKIWNKNKILKYFYE